MIRSVIDATGCDRSLSVRPEARARRACNLDLDLEVRNRPFDSVIRRAIDCWVRLSSWVPLAARRGGAAGSRTPDSVTTAHAEVRLEDQVEISWPGAASTPAMLSTSPCVIRPARSGARHGDQLNAVGGASRLARGVASGVCSPLPAAAR